MPLFGAFLLITGIFVILMAMSSLGRFYSPFLVIKKDHQLIQDGIYRHLRHPFYFGSLLFSFGIPLILSSLIGFGIMLLVIPILLGRIRIEEGMLLEEFGEEYKAYMETTRKLIPYIF